MAPAAAAAEVDASKLPPTVAELQQIIKDTTAAIPSWWDPTIEELVKACGIAEQARIRDKKQKEKADDRLEPLKQDLETANEALAAGIGAPDLTSVIGSLEADIARQQAKVDTANAKLATSTAHVELAWKKYHEEQERIASLQSTLESAKRELRKIKQRDRTA